MTAANLSRGFRSLIFLFSFASLCCAQDSRAASQAANAWDFPDFSATQIFGGKTSDMPMKVYRSGSSVRVERSGALSTLYIPAEGMVYNFTTYPDQSHQCTRMKPQQAKMLPSPLELIQGVSVQRTPIGTDEKQGHPCKVETVVATQSDGSSVESKVWEAEDLEGIPVRIESKFPDMTLSAVYQDISIGAPDAGLFAIPGRCTPLENMGQVAEKKTLK
jgi:hypothetical protein